MKIRKATPADARAVKSAHYHAYQVSYRGYLPDEFLDAMAVDEAAIERTANKIKEVEYYVAEVDGQVIGFAILCYPEDKAVEIQALYVHPDFQKHGAGSALIKEISRIKKAEGYKTLIAWTMKRGPSLGFYLKQGLKISHPTQEKLWQFDIPIIRLDKDI